MTHFLLKNTGDFMKNVDETEEQLGFIHEKNDVIIMIYQQQIVHLANRNCGFKHSDRIDPDSEYDACAFHPDSTGVYSWTMGKSKYNSSSVVDLANENSGL